MKMKIYLDTSVISHLDQPEKPTEQEYSRRLWENIINGKYDVFLSEVVFEEIASCKEDKRNTLTDYISQIAFHHFNLSEQDESLAKSIIERGVLPHNSFNDSRHLAAALSVKCDCLLSWNLKHLANHKTNEKVRVFYFDNEDVPLVIIKPSVLVEGEFYYEKNTTPAAGDK
jgi:predicted nucleic acid-binding protein